MNGPKSISETNADGQPTPEGTTADEQTAAIMAEVKKLSPQGLYLATRFVELLRDQPDLAKSLTPDEAFEYGKSGTLPARLSEPPSPLEG